MRVVLNREKSTGSENALDFNLRITAAVLVIPVGMRVTSVVVPPVDA